MTSSFRSSIVYRSIPVAVCIFLGIAASPAAPQPERIPLQRMVDEAIAAKKATVVLPAGRFFIDGSRVTVSRANNLVIEGAGSNTVLLNAAPDAVFAVIDSSNVTLRNFTIDYDPLPFTQATVVSISDDQHRIGYEIHDGYPSVGSNFAPTTAWFFDNKTRRWKEGLHDAYFEKNEIASPRSGTLISRSPAELDLAELSVGDHLVLSKRRPAMAVYFRTSDTVSLVNVHILSSPDLGVCCRWLTGSNYFSYKIYPGPTPAGAVDPRLLSTCADGFNYAIANRGPVLENCDFSFMGDDSVNIHGIAMMVISNPSPTRLLLTDISPFSHRNMSLLKRGDTVRLLKFGNFEIADEVALSSYATNHPDLTWAAISSDIRRQWNFPKSGRFQVCEIGVERPISRPLSPGDGVCFPSIDAPGYIIRSNYFHDHRAMGLRLMASHGRVEGNTIERVKYAAIRLGHSYPYWSESGWVSDVTIVGNVIRSIGQSKAMLSPTLGTIPGAISICAASSPGTWENPFPRQNTSIAIIGNVIEGSSVDGVHVYGAKDILVQSNVIREANMKNSARAGEMFGLPSGYGITVWESDEVRIVDNRIEHPGPFSKGDVKIFAK
ncbi:MAG: right-handed parallel beta-helix repeat-containing protein [Spirochaetota bacterium]